MNRPISVKHKEHASYRKHRRQVWAQVILPVVLGAALLFVAPVIAWASAMNGGGDLSRWAAISTMWLLIPMMIGAVILFAVLITLIFITGRIHGLIPRFTRRLQAIAFGIAGGTKRVAEMTRRPVLALQAVGSMAKARLQGLRERVLSRG